MSDKTKPLTHDCKEIWEVVRNGDLLSTDSAGSETRAELVTESSWHSNSQSTLNRKIGLRRLGLGVSSSAFFGN